MLTDLMHLQSDIRALNGAVLTQLISEIRINDLQARARFDISAALALALSDSSTDDVAAMAEVEDLLFVLANPSEVEARLVSVRMLKPSSSALIGNEPEPGTRLLNVAYLTHVMNLARADIPTACVRCGITVSLARRLRDLNLAELHALASTSEIRFTPRAKEALLLRLATHRRNRDNLPTGKLLQMASGLWGVAA